MPVTEDPLAKGIEEDGTQKVELMKLVIEQSTQIKNLDWDGISTKG